MAVEHSTDGRTFSEIGRIDGAGTTQTPQNYSFRHADPAPGNNYYRLRQVDLDGTFKYHGPVAVQMPFGKKALSAYPTVVESELYVNFSSSLTEKATLSIIGPNGQVYTDMPWFEKNHRLSVAHLPAGLYVLRLQSGRQIGLARFVKK